MNPQIKQTLILCSARLRLSSLFYAAEFSGPFSVSGSGRLFALTIQHAKIQHFLKFASICVIMWNFCRNGGKYCRGNHCAKQLAINAFPENCHYFILFWQKNAA